MKHMLFFICALALAAAANSCTQEMVLIEKEKEPVVVVSCIMTEGPVQTLKIVLAKGDLMESAPIEEEVKATLLNVTYRMEVGQFERQDDSTWTIEYTPRQRNSYRLEIRIPGHDLIWAELLMPFESFYYGIAESRMAKVSSVYRLFDEWDSPFSSSAGPNGDYVAEGFLYYITEFYYPIWIRGLNYNPETGARETADWICTDASYADVFNQFGVYDFPAVGAVSLGHKDWTDESNPKPDNRLFETSLYGNLRGLPMNKGYLRLKVDSKDQDYLDSLARTPISISGSFTGKYYEGRPVNMASMVTGVDNPVKNDEGYLLASMVTDDYDLFLRDALNFHDISGSTDISSLFIRNNVHSNINGGIGIFGAKLERILGWKPAYLPHTDDEGYPVVASLSAE